jgi:hypothetical protein
MRAKQVICLTCRKKFKPEHVIGTLTIALCSCKCAVPYYASRKPKSRKLAREVANMVGRRSMAEVKFDAAHIEGKAIDARYEVDVFEYNISEIRKYTPDWTVHKKNGRVVYLEFKGVLDGKTRKKMKLMKKQYPNLDLRLIFEKAGNKIYKGSKTTYGKWATQHGFKWEDNVMPQDCKK